MYRLEITVPVGWALNTNNYLTNHRFRRMAMVKLTKKLVWSALSFCSVDDSGTAPHSNLETVQEAYRLQIMTCAVEKL